MGVPKFFRYTSERYPCLNELVKPHQIPDFDNMYLDMNGIIHNCSHPDDSNPHFRITEEKIFEDIFHYLSILFQIIKPKKLFFMAIDGVAPRAKMNQQRGRRFRSAREAEVLEEQARAKGEVLPTEKRFDSNCITPGTVFMTRLHDQLRYFVRRKITTDPLWAKVKVILSGHETPGEGEHKIMDYIRWARSQPDYDATTRHCLYGLDADLIMLGMCTHELHFALLREEVKFGKTTQRSTCPEETNFYLLHLSLLRQYLEQEFIAIKDSLPFEYDLEKIVDDWVLMGFLVGNDFIPNLPNMHISNDALPLLYSAYMKVLPTLDGYINESGELNLARFELFMQELAKIDKEKFQDTYADLKYFEGKTGRRPNAKERKEYKPNNDETFNVNLDDIRANKPDDELQALINATHDMFMDDVDDEVDYDELDTSDEESNFNMEFKLHKKDYYMNKLDYNNVTDSVLVSQASGYARAIQWNLYYYYRGCPSWSWYYPHHYAPYMSDIKGIGDLKIEFELGEPFKPFEQLLAVLPAASKSLLPSPFHELMTDEASPIIHYYPVNFETDLNGKKNDWEAVVLIPFIDEANLLTAMLPCYQRLTDEERKRNTHGPMLVYNWSQQSQGTVTAPQYFPPIRECHASETRVYREELVVAPERLRSGVLESADRDLVFPGFPTMKHLKYKMELKKCKVKVFDQPSRNESMIVQLEPRVEPALQAAAAALLGRAAHVGWPHLSAARVTSVSNEQQRLHYASGAAEDGTLQWTVEANTGNLHKQWLSERATVIEHNMNRLGIELGDVNILVHACNLKGYKYIVQDDVSMALEPEWCTLPCGYAHQAVVTDVREYVAPVATRLSTVAEAYPAGAQVFLVTQGTYYGCLATVVDSTSVRSGRVKVTMCAGREPVPSARAAPPPYRPANQAAQLSGVSPALLSRVTGTVLVAAGARRDVPTEQLDKANLGLNLKFNKKNQEVSGFTRRDPTSGVWQYSRRCSELVAAYAQHCPPLFDALANKHCDVFFEGDLWPDDVGKDKTKETLAWLKAQPHAAAARRECGSEALEPEELRALADSIDEQLAEISGEDKKVTLHVKWSLLYKPDLHSGNISPDPAADFALYDRVVCVAANSTVPLGARGTVTAVYRAASGNTVRLHDKLNAEPTYQVMFDEPFPGAMKEELFDTPRFYRMQPSTLLNISFGRKLRGPAYAVPDDAFVYGAPPTALRRHPAAASAFASYSPTKDRQTPVAESRATPLTPTAPGAPAAPAAAPAAPAPVAVGASNQDTNNGTELLKSLLKICQDSPDTPKQSKKQQDQNWRARTDAAPAPLAPAPPAAQKPPAPALSWRQEGAAPRPQQDWSPTAQRGYSGQPPIPPFPNFNQPFQQPNPQQYQSPQFQRNQNNLIPFGQAFPAFAQAHVNGRAGSGQNGGGGPAPPPTFPQHLPTVGADVTLAPPAWIKQKTGMNPAPAGPEPAAPAGPVPPAAAAATAPAADKMVNPFVPLQVQAKRRVQNPTGPANFGREPAPSAAAPPPPAAPAQETEQSQAKGRGRPQRKKKPRIAANLPFVD